MEIACTVSASPRLRVNPSFFSGMVQTSPKGAQVKWAERRSRQHPFKVLVNHEEQYTIWPRDKDDPLGWHAQGKTGSK
ncbi:MAG TPA: MbtH family NRPS accessory protein [Rhizomicrobium sp.]